MARRKFLLQTGQFRVFFDPFTLWWKKCLCRARSIHISRSKIIQCWTDTWACSGLTLTFLESPIRIGGPEVLMLTPPRPIPGLLLRSDVDVVFSWCCWGWLLVDETARHWMKEMKRDEKKSDKIKALNLVRQKALHVVLQRYTTMSSLLITFKYSTHH